MVQKNNFTLRLDGETRQRVGQAAKDLDRSSAWVIHQALRAYLDQQDWLKRQLEKSGAEEGPPIPHETLMRALNDAIGGAAS